MSDSFSGTMGSQGFQPDDVPRWKQAKLTYQGKRVSVTLEREHSIRTLRQNNRYWIQCQAVADLLSVGRDVPLNKDQAHIILASAFLGLEETKLGTVPISTRTLTVEQFNLYMDRIDSHFAAEGTPLPTMEAC